jgi:drug/metabolite transporter (DMT)-like permease
MCQPCQVTGTSEEATQAASDAAAAQAEHARRSRLVGVAAVLSAVMLFALSLSIIKWPGIPGSVIAWWRLVGSSILWWVVLHVRRARTGRPLPSAATWKLAVVPALFFGINISFTFNALTRTSIAHADFIAAMSPLVTMPLGFLIFRERPQWKALGWGVLSIVGIAIVLFNGPAKGVATWQGDVLAALGMAGLACYLVTAKYARAKGVETFDLMALVMPMALITATPVVLVIAGDQLWPLSWKAWTAIAILSVMTGMVAHGLLVFAHPRVPIATMSTMQVSQPALSAVWAWLLLGEAIAPAQIPGMALVIIGLALVSWTSSRRAAASRP